MLVTLFGYNKKDIETVLYIFTKEPNFKNSKVVLNHNVLLDKNKWDDLKCGTVILDIDDEIVDGRSPTNKFAKIINEITRYHKRNIDIYVPILKDNNSYMVKLDKRVARASDFMIEQYYPSDAFCVKCNHIHHYESKIFKEHNKFLVNRTKEIEHLWIYLKITNFNSGNKSIFRISRDIAKEQNGIKL